MRIELNTDFMSVEDLKDLGASYNMFENLAKHDKKIDCERVYHVLYTYYLLKYNSDAKVTYQLNPVATSIKDFGSVTVAAKNIHITNTDALRKAAQLASNFEIYPKTDGNVDASFGFYGLTSGENQKDSPEKYELSMLSKENRDLFLKECKDFLDSDDVKLRILFVYRLLKSIDEYCVGTNLSYDFAACSVSLDADIVEFDDMWKFAEVFRFADEVVISQQAEDAVHIEFCFKKRENENE